MKADREKRVNGFTMTELLVTIIITAITVLAVGSVLLHSHQSFLNLYANANADIVTDAYVVRNLFDSTVRKASASEISITNNGQNASFEYYDSGASTFLDGYTSFSISGGDFLAEYGTLAANGSPTVTDTKTICSNVVSCKFLENGPGVSIILNLDDGDKARVVVSTAYAHN